MTQQPKSRTVGCWLVLDAKGEVWQVQCVCCEHKLTLARNLLQSAVTPQCPRCGARSGPIYVEELPPWVDRSCTVWDTASCVASEPVDASKPPTPAVVPVQVAAGGDGSGSGKG